MAERTAEIKRKTKETDITLSLSLDGSGQFDVSTGIGMLDHMLEQLAKHGRFDLRIRATGDIDRDTHHLTEDIGIVLGQAFDKALGDRRGITRFGDATIPLDETLALVAIDLSGRPHADVALEFDRDLIGELPTENLWHLLESFAKEGRMTLHVRLLAGTNDHHRAEAVFKALARALRAAVSLDPAAAGDVPSTKEVL
ncbi:MAG: imidazoleglycerol-phosphate dehydratase HisB [Chloroflexi bacterium]|nr:imidazoleglycerol-phosphate dehydratase HisB [Chloroflexota bacterium]